MSLSKKRKLQGVIVSDAMDKTVVVAIEKIKTHAKYHRQYKVKKKYKIHDPKNEFHKGDMVVFEECRPMSKDKRWKIIKKIK